MTKKNQDLAVRFIEAFGRGDRAQLRQLVTPDVVFASPRATVTGAEAVVTAIADFAEAVTDVSIETVLADADQAMVAYAMTVTGLGTLSVVDRLRLRDGRIAADTVVFDTHAVRRAEAAGGGGEAAVIRYRTLPESADTNEKLIADVFAQLATEDPGGVRYAAFRLDDGDGFVHIVINEPDGARLTDLSSFAEFQREFGSRVPGGPDRSGATLIGAYRMID